MQTMFNLGVNDAMLALSTGGFKQAVFLQEWNYA
jgi:hypothetical protein